MSRTLTARPIAAALPAAAAVAGGGAIAVVALALRLSGLARVAPDPFYDAAVRSMGLSWHNFLFGALEPGGTVSIDKPAVGLWPQVVATKLLGFHTSALLLPQALAGSASVGLVFLLGRALWGRAAGLAAAAALAVLPLAVLTARSDTMDALATMVTLVAAVALLRGARAGGRWPVAAAGAALGVAFNVKLFQALIPAPALAVLYYSASPLPRLERLSRLALCAAIALTVGLSWLAAVSTAPGREQPFAFGSRNGSALSATFGYNGIDRLSQGTRPGRRSAAALAARPNPPGPGRLVGKGAQLDTLLGTELVPALILGGVAVGLAGGLEARRRRRRAPVAAPAPAEDEPTMADDPPAPAVAPLAPSPARLARAGALATATWLVTAILLFSALHALQVRYVETLAPAVALAFGGGVAALAGRGRLPAWAMVAGVAALLAVPAARALDVVHSAASDSGHLGQLRPAEVQRLSAFLQPRTAGQRYEVASATAVKATPLIVHDARPVLMLATLVGRQLTPLRRFLRDVRDGQVSYVLIAGQCGAKTALAPGGCGVDARWAVAHGRQVSPLPDLQIYKVTSEAAYRSLLPHHPLRRHRYSRKAR